MSGILEPSPFYNDFRAILGQNKEIFGPWSGVIFRSVSPQYARPNDILSGHGAYQAGGRWNAPGIYAIYGSLEPGLAADKEFCRQTNLTLDIFTRLVGTSRRAVATWLSGNPPNRANERNLTELSRLFAALAELVPTDQIGSWLETSNSAFEGSTPVQVIERGESDRIWRMIWELRDGNSGD
jgi:hypothetical protein